MKRRVFGKGLFLIMTGILVFVFFVSWIVRSIDEEQKKKIVVDFIGTALTTMHFKPVAINDDMSEKAFNLFIKRMDYNKRFFLQTDIDELKKYETRLDDEMVSKNFSFYRKAVEIYKRRVELTQKFYREILSRSFDFNKDEQIETDPDKIQFCKNEKELKEYWRKMLKFQVLSRLNASLEIQEQSKNQGDTTIKIQSFEALEKEAREKLLKNYDETYNRMAKTKDADYFSLYINSIINVFDPHSDFMPPDDKKNFDISMSGKLEGIGATLQESGGYIKVVNIVPGSPAWLQGELQVNDIILKVAQGNEEPVDIVDMRIDDAVKLIRGKKGTEVRLTVKKVDGSIKLIKIIRDVVIIEETYARSALLKDGKDTTFVVGYIFLPKFYADFNDRNGRTCADDVKKELEKIKKENPRGIILDLRNNGGGSLMDAVNMAGLFIKEGPVVQVKGRYGPPAVLEDKDPQIHYRGPLVVLINEFSASASEILAAAMQDYGRAVIVGSKSFGKGTVQRILEIDDYVPAEYASGKPYGALKITIQKFYRINGGSTQLKGVTPDIILNDIYSYIERGEAEQEYPMPWSEIQPVPYQKWDTTYNLTELAGKSQMRVEKDSAFIVVEQKAMNNKQLKDETLFVLNFNTYRQKQKQTELNNRIFDLWQKKPTGLLVRNLKEDNMARRDTATLARNRRWLEDLSRDVYLKESVNIIRDMQ